MSSLVSIPAEAEGVSQDMAELLPTKRAILVLQNHMLLEVRFGCKICFKRGMGYANLIVGK